MSPGVHSSFWLLLSGHLYGGLCSPIRHGVLVGASPHFSNDLFIMPFPEHLPSPCIQLRILWANF